MLKSLFIVCFVSKFLLVNSQDNVITIRFKTQTGKNISCTDLKPRYTLTEGHIFTIDILSHFYIIDASWWGYKRTWRNFLDLDNTTLNISLRTLSSPSLHYSLKYTQKISSNQSMFKHKKWKFKFQLYTTENVYPVRRSNYNRWEESKAECETEIYLASSHMPFSQKYNTVSKENEDKGPKINIVTIILGTIAGLTMLVQMVYIIYVNVKARAATRDRAVSNTAENVYTVRESTTNIADRPPLPLPNEAINHKVSKSHMSPALKRLRPSDVATPPVCGKTKNTVNVVLKRDDPPARRVKDIPMPPPIPGSSPGLFKKSKALPPIIPAQTPRRTPVLHPVQRTDQQDSSDEEWNYEPLKPVNNFNTNNIYNI